MITIIESPFAGDIPANIAYARACVRAVLTHSPEPHHVTASHLLYTQEGILDDAKPEERKLGMEAGWALYKSPGAVCVACLDRGVSGGMVAGVRKALECGRLVFAVTLQHGALVTVQNWNVLGDGTWAPEPALQADLEELRKATRDLAPLATSPYWSLPYLKIRSELEALNA